MNVSHPHLVAVDNVLPPRPLRTSDLSAVQRKIPVVDPGFAEGGGTDLTRGCQFLVQLLSKKFYVETKELGLLGGGMSVLPPMDRPMNTASPYGTFQMLTGRFCSDRPGSK